MDPQVLQEKQRQILERTRLGLLKYVSDQGGTSDLGSMHAFSEKTYFIAHQSFSRVMEGLVGDGLLAFDHQAGRATLTETGRGLLNS